MSADSAKNARTEVVVVVGAGAIGQAIARRIGVAKTILLADINEDTAKKAATLLSGVGYETRTSHVNVSSRESVNALARWQLIAEMPDLMDSSGFVASMPCHLKRAIIRLLGFADHIEEEHQWKNACLATADWKCRPLGSAAWG